MGIKFKQSDFMANVQKLRKEKGYTLKKLSTLSMIERVRLGFIISGTTLPTYNEVEKLANVFNISVEELIGNNLSESILKKKVLNLVEKFLKEKHNEKFKNELALIMLDKGAF